MKSLSSCLLLLFFLLACAIISHAQTGSYFITHYNPGEHNFDNTNYAVLQDERGIMHFANRQGVLQYDGNSWWLTPTPYSIFCLAESKDKLYVGGREGFGEISRSGMGELIFKSIDSLHRNITEVVVIDGSVYYMDDHHLYRFHEISPDNIQTVYTAEDELLDLVKIDGYIYLTSSENGLKLVSNNKLIEVDDYIHESAYFIRKSNSGRLLHFTDSSDIYVTINDSITKLDFSDKKYLAEHEVTGITWVTDSLIAISSLSGGVIFVNATSGHTEQIVDFQSGLADNQVNTIYTAKTGEVWAVHSSSLSVISPGLPLRSYNHYPGLSGTLIMAFSYRGQLVVGTSVGVFRLTEKRQVRETVVYDRIRIMEAKEEVVKHKPFRGLFKNKKRKNEATQKKKETGTKYKYVYRKRIVEEELSVNYEYERVRGINAKTVNLISYRDQLLAGTVHGVYQIIEDSAYLIDQVPVLNMFGVPNANLLFVSTVDEEVKVLTYERGKWRQTNMLEGLNDYIVQVTIDPDNNIWLCGADSLYRLEIEGLYLNDVEVFSIDNPHFERIYSVNFEGQILFINSSGYYTYKDRKIQRNDEIAREIGLPKKYILAQDGELLVNTGFSWYGADKNLKNSLNFLSLFKDPHYVAKGSANDFWVITATNDLFKIKSDEVSSITINESIYLKEIRNENGKIPLGSELVVNQENSSLTFEFASPDYSGIYQKQYQYRLANTAGTQSQWSSWAATNNVISYQFLPTGSYVLEARFRNALGEIINAEPYTFKVIPPYWKRPWFYVGELLFFGSLLMFTFYLNRGKGKYSFMSRLLGFLTLILIVEFFQTVAEYNFETNESPVINFFLQAFIALLILPVESLFRKWLTREKKAEIPGIEKS